MRKPFKFYLFLAILFSVFSSDQSSWAIRAPDAPATLPGVQLDEAPKRPPRVRKTGKKRPPQKQTQPSQTQTQTQTEPLEFEPFSLPGNPRSESVIEQELRAYISNHFTDLEINSLADLRLDYIRIVPGQSGLADMAYARFIQVSDGIEVDNGEITFTIKLYPQKALVTNMNANIFPDASAAQKPKIDKEWAKEKFQTRLGNHGKNRKFNSLGKKIRWIKNKWKVVEEFDMEDSGIRGAVDGSGETTVWDARLYAYTYTGYVKGRGVLFDPKATGDNLEQLLLQDLKVEGGNLSYTNAQGNYSTDVNSSDDFLTFRLKGKFCNVTTPPYELVVNNYGVNPMNVLFNEISNSQFTTSQVNAYYHTTLIHNWSATRGVAPAGINVPIVTKVNIDKTCNASYTIGQPSLNFFRSGYGCLNSAYDTIIYHEYGHFIDDMIGGISWEDGLTEGWGDVVASYASQQPLIGENFYTLGGSIRTADNNYFYNATDEIHTNGQAWAGFAWHLRQNLIGTEGLYTGRALAENLVIPVFLANPQNIPDAVYQVLLRDDDDGNLQNGTPHLQQITDAATRHGLVGNLPIPDTANPTVTILAPVNSATVGGMLTVSGTAQDNVGLSKVEIQIDGGTFNLASGLSLWIYPFNTAALPDGSHMITAKATDSGGNITLTAITINVVNTATVPNISSVTVNLVTQNTAVIHWNTDILSDSNIEYGLTSLYGSSTPYSPNLFYSHFMGIYGLTAGTTYHFRARSKDESGHQAVSPDFTFTTLIDTNPLNSVDIGFKYYDGSQTVTLAAEPVGTVTSPLRIRKGNTTYGLLLVDPADPQASKIVIQTSAGKKAIKRF